MDEDIRTILERTEYAYRVRWVIEALPEKTSIFGNSCPIDHFGKDTGIWHPRRNEKWEMDIHCEREKVHLSIHMKRVRGYYAVRGKEMRFSYAVHLSNSAGKNLETLEKKSVFKLNDMSDFRVEIDLLKHWREGFFIAVEYTVEYYTMFWDIRGQYLEKEHSRKLFKQEFNLLYQEGEDPDVCIEVGGEELFVHRSVLFPASTYFETMCDTGMIEAQEGRITLNHTQPSIFRKMMEFLYTDNIDILSTVDGDLTLEMLYEYYATADMYGILDFRLVCANRMRRHFTVSNIFNVLLWADRHSDKDLKRDAMYFMGAHAIDIDSNDDWKLLRIREPALCAELRSYIDIVFMHRILCFRHVSNEASKLEHSCTRTTHA